MTDGVGLSAITRRRSGAAALDMTKKLTQFEPQHAMELDLDSFLNSHLSEDEDEDDELNSVPRRTIDEILNDTDSSRSASPSTSPRNSNLTQFLASDPKPPQPPPSDAVSVSSVKTEGARQLTQLDEKAVRPSLNFYSRAKSSEFSDDSLGRVSRPSPWLLGGVRTNAKPGAALAAAAAASRSMPTPHAAAIKSRRSAGSGSFQKAVEAAELGDKSEIGSNYNDDGNAVGSETTASNSNEVEEEDFGGDLGRKVGVLERERERESELEPETQVDEVIAGAEEVTNISVDENSSTLDATDIKDIEFDENAQVAVECSPEKQDLDENRPSSKHSDGEDEPLGGDAGNDEVGDNDTDNDDDDDDDALGTSITQLVEERIEQLESRRISKKAEKKSRKPLEIAELLEKKQASTALDWEEGAAAQPMRLEGVRRGSTTLGYFNVDANNTITRTLSAPALRRDHGSPQVLAVHSNYIAIGMSRGVVLVVPSKYSAHNADNMDAKLLFLGLQGERSYAAVTSISFNQQGDLLLAGYADGHLTVWDVQRASAAKVITGEHTAPVVHTFFLGHDSQVTRNFKAVTGDSKGLVLLHSFSVVPLLNRFSIKTQCLIDGQKTGMTLSASPLLFDELCGGSSLSSQGNATVSGSSIGGMMGGVVGGDAGWKLFNEGSSLVEEGVVVFVTHQNALVVRLTPTLHKYAQLSKPDGVREGSMPCTAWKCTTQLHSSPTNSENMSTEAVERVSLLAIAWDRKVQVAKLVKSELKVYGKWSLESAAIGVAWLDDQMLVVLTMTGQLCLFAKDGTVIHQTSFSLDGFGGDDLISYHTHFINVFGNPEKAYHNCIAVRGASVYVLGPTHLIVCRLLPWKERIQVLRRAGDWMGSLNMAMTIYDGQAHGVVDLPRTLDAVQEAIMPYLVELLLSYVEEVFSYISVAFCNQIGKMDQVDDLNRQSSSVHAEIKEQYTRVGGVAVEFCVHIKRTDILFDEIFSKFVAVQQRGTFLELLEPYILKDMLGSLPPEIMQALVEHYSRKGWLQRVEQCVLHMDISSLDFNQVVRLCREHGLYSALVYLFNKGLNDFRSPLEELLVVLQNSQKEGATALGYRMLVYLKYCFSGLAFPPGQGKIPPSRLPSLRTELLQFLLECSDASNSRAVSSELSGVYLNLYFLLELDTEATLDVLRCAFTEDETSKPDVSSQNSADADTELQYENNSMAQSQNSLVQNTIDTLIHIISKDISQTDGSTSSFDTGSTIEWPSKKDIDHLFEFIAYYVACGKANVSKTVLSQILEYLTSENNVPSSVSGDSIISKRREKQVLDLLEVVPETDWNSSSVLQLCEKAQFYQVCGLIHTSKHQYLAALDCYMKDAVEPIHAFSFINKILLQLTDDECAAFRSAVISRIPELFDLNREGAFFLVMDHFTSEEGSHILSELRSHPRSLFLYLKTVIEVHLSATLNFSSLRNDNLVGVKDQTKGVEAFLERVSNFPKLLRDNPVNVTDDMIELYLELLCQFERNSVLKFLETFDSYRVEHCLRLCQKYGIIDASSFLLERVGDVGSALLLTVSTLNDKFVKLETAVGSLASSGASLGFASTEYFSNALKVEEVNDIDSILHACIGLCQRNTHRLNPDESEALWFRLLDSFCEPLMDSLSAGTVSKAEDLKSTVAKSLDSQEDEMNFIIKWRIPKPHKGADILRKLFSRFIKEIVEGMIGYVRLPTIMSKLLSDNGSQEFGDFKFTILGMLSTYGFERRILDTAKSLIEDDTFYTMSILKKGASHGYAPRNQKCCICDCLLDKNSSSYIRIFNCGHATHLKCEVSENETSSRSSSSGCPVCMPKKKSQSSKNKSVLAEDSLVKEFSSRTQHTHGTTVHPHESNASENSYGFQQISRFEILTNLQRDRGLVEIENMPQLRLAPPAMYHEKVKHGTVLSPAESSSDLARIEKQSKIKQLREVKVKGPSLRFPLKSSIFGNGKEKISRR